MPLSHDQLVTDCHGKLQLFFFLSHMPVRSTGEPPSDNEVAALTPLRLPIFTLRLAMLIRSCHQRQLERQVDQCLSSNELAEDR